MDYTQIKFDNQKLRGHALMTDELKAQLPKLYATEEQKLKAVAQVKYFTPDSSWYWYATEFDGQDRFFGIVFGSHVEYGYFSLTELEITRGPLKLPIERDLGFTPQPLEVIVREHQRNEGVDIRQYCITIE